MPPVTTRRLLTWGVIGGAVGGAAFAVGHVLGFLAADSRPLVITAAWLNLAGVSALVFATVGVHEPLRDRGTPLAGLGAALTLLGFTLLVGFFTLRIALAYGLITADVTQATEMVGLSLTANGTLLAGLLVLGVAVHRSGAFARPVGVGLVLAALAFAVGFVVPVGGAVGGLLLGAAFAWAANDLRRMPHGYAPR